MLRGQGEALNVDRHELYQALFYAIGAAPLGALQPPPDASTDSAAAGASPAAAAAAAGAGGAGQARRGGGARSWDGGGAGAGEEAAGQLPLDVLLARTAHQMLVEQVRWLQPLLSRAPSSAFVPLFWLSCASLAAIG
jgi:hypothetical protein